jgi:hypothetical protein
MSNHNTYATIEIVDINNVDFSQIGETSISTIRKSIDQTEFVIKWLHDHTPTFIVDGSVIPIQTYNHDEALILMQTPAWAGSIP